MDLIDAAYDVIKFWDEPDSIDLEGNISEDLRDAVQTLRQALEVEREMSDVVTQELVEIGDD